MDTLRHLLRNRRYVSVALVTLLTLGIMGAVVLTTTSAGCGPASALKIKTAHCAAPLPVANRSVSPAPQSPFTLPTPTPQSPPPFIPAASSNPPDNPGASAYPPYNPGSSGTPPYTQPGSFGAPPLPFAGSSVATGLVSSCRLPVYAGGPGSGGFVVFPGATFIADPRSAVTVPSPSPGGPSPSPPPGYGPGGPAGWYGMTYDAAYSKWLPVPYAWVSPDGVHYAYPLGGEVYVQNVSNGTQLELGEGHNFNVIDVENNGVYAEPFNLAGLWFLPYSGAITQVATNYFWQAVGYGAAYGTATSQVPQGASNTIAKLDLKTGSVAAFFTQPGVSTVVGFDLQGDPIVNASYPQGGSAIFIVTGPSSSTVITAFGYQYYNGAYPNGNPIADKYGIWYSIGGGVVLYTGGQWYLMSNIGGQLAGQCL